MKQTAVEFLMEKLFDPSTMVQEQIEWFEEAKKMEKEQIENAYDKGQESEWHKSMGLMGDHYYNETFNTK
jgi:hypothetical protein